MAAMTATMITTITMRTMAMTTSHSFVDSPGRRLPLRHGTFL
jgi:hypothetical protein